MLVVSIVLMLVLVMVLILAEETAATFPFTTMRQSIAPEMLQARQQPPPAAQ